MKISNISLAILSLIIAVSCGSTQNTPEPPPNPPAPTEPTEERMDICICPKMNDKIADDCDFGEGDAIGLYVVNYDDSNPRLLSNTGNYVDNMRFTYNNTWRPDSLVTWKDNNTKANFYVYYPYGKVTDVKAHTFNVQPVQSQESNYKASDFLLGKLTGVLPTGSTVEIPVNHVFSRVVMTFAAGNNFTAESIEGANVHIKLNGLKCSASINLETGSVTPQGQTYATIPFKTGESYMALVVPQTVKGHLITVTVRNTQFNLQEDFTFESGKSYEFNIKLDMTSTGVNVNIKPWIEEENDNGGTAE